MNTLPPVAGETPILIEGLKRALPKGVVDDDPGVVEGYCEDIAGRYPGEACAVARPHGTAEEAQVVLFSAGNGFPLVPQGGATGLVGGELQMYGHIGDGNLHVNIIGRSPDDALDDEILRCGVAHEGTISAEHGIERAKRQFLPLRRSQSDIAAMFAVKQALDLTKSSLPKGICPPDADSA